MEITAQIAALEGEINLVKSEIKSILEEIRTVVLDRENPFAASGLPVFRPVSLSEPMGESAPGQEESSAPADSEEAPEGPMPPPKAAEPTPPPSPAPAGNQASDIPSQALPPQPDTASPQSRQSPAPLPLADATGFQPWSVSTIANLIGWIDETSSRLGATHLHMILDLARFADLFPSEAEGVLLKVVKLATGRKDSASPSINDILLALRQLEAVLEGERRDELSLARRSRTAGRSR